MLIEVKRQLQYPDIVNGVPKKRVLTIGRHSVNNASLSHWFVQSKIHTGGIVLVGDTEPEPKKLSYKEKQIPVIKQTLETIRVQGVQPIYPEVKEKEIAPQPEEEAPMVVFPQEEIEIVKGQINTDVETTEPRQKISKRRKKA
jgi:hypothetical protein